METYKYGIHNQDVSSNYLSPSWVQTLSPTQEQTKIEEISLPTSLTYPKRYSVKMHLFFVVLDKPLGESSVVYIAEKENVIGDKEFREDKLTVFELKKLIWKELNGSEKGSNEANRWTLWKVENFIEGDKKWVALENTKDNSIETYIRNELGGIKLTSAMRLRNDVFPSDPPEGMIHIIVQPPTPATTGKRRLEEDEDEEDKCPAKKEKLYLQQQEKERFRNLVNNLPNIDTRDKVFRIPELPGDNGDADIYNRECYKYLCDFILEDSKFKRYLITGNPGIRKTFFERLMLIELLKKGKTVLLDYETLTVRIKPSGEITYVEGKSLFRQMAEQPDVWCIIDGKRDQVGHDFSNGKLIMVSSPKKAIIGDFAKQWCRELFMPTWSKRELIDCWNHLYKGKGELTLESLKKKSLKKKFKVCGGIARWIFTMSLEDIEMAIEKATKTVKSEILYHQGQVLSGDEYTHKLIHMHTNVEKMGKFPPYTTSTCFFASKYVADKCLKQLQLNHKKELFDFINNAEDITQLGGFRGTLFEMVAHTIIRQGGDFRVRELTDDSKGPEGIHSFDSLEEQFFDNVNKIQVQGKYCRPTSKTFESIDSYAHPNNLFQVTVSKKHSIKQDGLRAIKSILDENFDVKIYFVLPREIFETFKRKQSYENKGEGKVFDPWIYDIKQYALCVNLKY